MSATKFIVLLAICALTMRTLIPAGFMLAPGGGMPRLVLCSGTMPAAMPMVMGGAGHDQHDGHKAPDLPCAFSAAAFSVDLATTVVPPAPVVARTLLAIVAPLRLRPGAGLAAPPPWQTGPPVFA